MTDYQPITGILGLDIFLGFIALVLLAWILYEIHWHLKYSKEYSEIKEDSGIVTDMDYTAPTSTYNAATKTTTTTPEEHDVFIKFGKLGDHDFDHEYLYQRVRVDDDVTATYQEAWQVEKQNHRNRKLMHFNFLTIKNPKGKVIELDDAKPASPILAAYSEEV